MTMAARKRRTRRDQIKKRGSEYVLMSADGKKKLGESKTLAGAEAIARRVYARHGKASAKKRAKKSAKRRVRCVSETRVRCSNPRRRKARKSKR